MAYEKILVVDDSPTVIDMTRSVLEQEGYKVIIANDGQQAMIKAYQEKPSLILLDVELPKINGYAICKQLKADSQTKDIPIIMLTVKDKDSDKVWGLGMGADEYLTKPFEMEVLVEVVKERLKAKGS